MVLEDETGEVIGEIAQGIGVATNNIAEYRALIAGLELALEKQITDIEVQVDSQLVVSQVTGAWKIKAKPLLSHAVTARSLLNKFSSSSIKHVRRELNADADKLANQGMDASAIDDDPIDPQQSSFSD